MRASPKLDSTQNSQNVLNLVCNRSNSSVTSHAHSIEKKHIVVIYHFIIDLLKKIYIYLKHILYSWLWIDSCGLRDTILPQQKYVSFKKYNPSGRRLIMRTVHLQQSQMLISGQ